MKKRIIAVIICLLVMVSSCSGYNQEEKMKESQSNSNETSQEASTPVENATTLKMDTSIKYQVLESFGTSGAWWAQYVGGWDNEYKETGHSVRDEIAMLLFDKDYGIGLTSYRYNIGAGSAESGKGTYWNVHRKTQSFETAPQTYDWTKDANAVWFMKKAVELGVPEIVMFCNSPLLRLTINGNAQVDKGLKQNILPENYDDFATYVMDVAEHFVHEGVPVKFISPINEPQWDWFEGQEGCHYEPGKIAQVYRAFLEELESRPSLSGIALSGPESGEWKGDAIAYTSAILNDTVLKGHFDTIDNHSYWSDTASKEAFKRWMDAKFPNIKIRMSEWCEMVNGSDVTMDSAFNLAAVVAEDLTVLNAVSWQNWVAIAPGGYRDGLIYVNETKKAFNPLKRLWGYGNYSKFIRPGYQRIEVSGLNDDVDALKPVDFIGVNDAGEDEMVVVVINKSDEDKNILLDIPNGVEYTNVRVYETSETKDLSCINDQKYTRGDAIAISKQSISTIILVRVGD